MTPKSGFMTQAATIHSPTAMYDRAHAKAGWTGSWFVPWFAALIIVTVGIRIADPTGWLGSDDWSYHSAAEHLLAGKTIERPHHHFARMAVVVPQKIKVIGKGLPIWQARMALRSYQSCACHLPVQTRSFGMPLNSDSPMILSITCLTLSLLLW